MASGSECQLLAGFLSEWILQDDVDLKAPIEPMEHIYYGELKKVRSLVAASASTGSADTQRHYRLLLYKIDQALK